MIYFDNSATTKVDERVLDTYVKTSQRIIGNPSSLHRLGAQATRLLEQSREQIAGNIGVSPEEIVFTSGGTEGNNWVIKGTALEKKNFGNHIIISDIEHSAVSKAAKQLEQVGFEISFLPVDEKGFIKLESLKKLLRKETILVSIMAVNNEIGSVQPIKEVGEMLADYPTVHLHVDAVQALGKAPVGDWLTSRVDFATFSSHKFHGPKGTGFVYKKKGRLLAPLLNGGGQEKDQRSGTENVPGVVAMAKAVRLHLEDEDLKISHEERIRNYLIGSLGTYERVTLFTEATDNFVPHIICFGIKGIKGEVLVHSFEEKDIIISTTSACSSRSKSSLSTLGAMKVPADISKTAVRISLERKSTLAEAEQFMVVFNQLYTKFSKING